MNSFYSGVIEDRLDPLKLGRCKVRVVGLHTEDKILLPTSDLPWAYPMQSITSAAMNGIGNTPTGPVLGTWVIVIFRDEDQQLPIMIGTVGGIPQPNNEDELEDEINSDDSEVTSVFDRDIPTEPPEGSTKDVNTAKESIVEIIRACDSVGLTSKYAKCAILGICGGESGWLAVDENFIYHDPKILADTFRSTFSGNIDAARPYTNWPGSREDFFLHIYNPNGNGKRVGNTMPDDGAKYFGRGFNQITGRSGYLKTQIELEKIGISADLINNPELINTPQIAAMACVLFYKNNVKHDQNHPGYFSAARKITGNNTSDGYDKKKRYYDYFLGNTVSIESTNKPQVDSQRITSFPIEKLDSLIEDRTGNQSIGFCDPSGKYPLRNMTNEPDTNRLARGVAEETMISFKDATRSTQIPMANNFGTWDQPIAPFGGEYPNVNVYESESGHIQMFDDTPGNETTSLYHRKGTYIDVDANGTQVNKIVGDGYFIFDRNGSIYISGKANITIGNDVNIMCLGNADIEVGGVSTINLKNDADIGVAGDLTLAVGGDMDVKVVGQYNLSAAGITTHSTEDIKTQSDKSITTKSIGDNITQAEGMLSSKASGEITIQSDSDVSLVSDADMYLTAGGDQNIQSGGSMLIDMIPLRPDYPEQVSYDYAGSGSDALVLEDILPIDLVVPELQIPTNIKSDNIPTPDRNFSGVVLFETPEDYITPDGIIERKSIAALTPPNVIADKRYVGNINETATPIPRNNNQITPSVLSSIKSRVDYPDNYMLSKHFSLANLGGGNIKKTKLLNPNRFRKSSNEATHITSTEIVENLAYVAENVLELIYEEFGPTGGSSLGGSIDSSGIWQINDALRSGANGSEHNEGCAVDIKPIFGGTRATFEMAKILVEILNFNQLILEYRSPSYIRTGQSSPYGSWQHWIHISHRKNGNIKEYATMMNDGVVTGYFQIGKILDVGDAFGQDIIEVNTNKPILINPTTPNPVQTSTKINLNIPSEWYKEFCRINGVPYNSRENQVAAKEYWTLIASRNPLIKLPK